MLSADLQIKEKHINSNVRLGKRVDEQEVCGSADLLAVVTLIFDLGFSTQQRQDLAFQKTYFHSIQFTSVCFHVQGGTYYNLYVYYSFKLQA